MLDDLHYMHERDAQGALEVAEHQSRQYAHVYNVGLSLSSEVLSVVVAGMGGSGLAAKALKAWDALTVPYEVVQEYELPACVTKHTLLVCVSYSGNTEEIISIFRVARALPKERQPMVVVVSAGGRLADLAKTQAVTHVALPDGYQPRMTFGLQVRVLLEIFQSAGVCNIEVGQLDDALQWLDTHTAAWTATVPTARNRAKQLALELMGKSIVIYGGPRLAVAAYKWKINFNENAKTVAWAGQLPEFCHNELIGWSSHPVEKPYAVVDLRSELEHTAIMKRFEVADRMLSGRRPAPEVVLVQGDSLVRQYMWAVAFGDFVSLYLALLNGLNPTPVVLLEAFKKEVA